MLLFTEVNALLSPPSFEAFCFRLSKKASLIPKLNSDFIHSRHDDIDYLNYRSIFLKKMCAIAVHIEADFIIYHENSLTLYSFIHAREYMRL